MPCGRQDNNISCTVTNEIYCQVAHIFAKYYKNPENVSYYYTHSITIVEKSLLIYPIIVKAQQLQRNKRKQSGISKKTLRRQIELS